MSFPRGSMEGTLKKLKSGGRGILSSNFFNKRFFIVQKLELQNPKRRELALCYYNQKRHSKEDEEPKSYILLRDITKIVIGHSGSSFHVGSNEALINESLKNTLSQVMRKYASESFEVHSKTKNLYLRCPGRTELFMWVVGLCSLCALFLSDARPTSEISKVSKALWPRELGRLPKPPGYILNLREGKIPDYELQRLENKCDV
eukprot:g3590.t1